MRGTSIDPAFARTVHAEAFRLADASQDQQERLEIVQAELLEPASWTGLADDCLSVVHTACPVNTDPGTPREKMLDPAVEGTMNVLREVARAGCARRVVHLSSVVTLLDQHLPVEHPERGVRLTSGDWNETASAQTDPYAHAKVRTERQARAFIEAEMQGTDFVAVLPGPVIGPPVAGSRVPGSIQKTMEPFLTGQLKAGSVALWLQLVDVRDVADVCARVLELDRAELRSLDPHQRFIAVSQPVQTIQKLADMIAVDFPEYRSRLPRRQLPLPRWALLAAMKLSVTQEAWLYTRAMLGRPLAYDTAPTERLLNRAWHDPRQSLRDTVHWLKRFAPALSN